MREPRVIPALLAAILVVTLSACAEESKPSSPRAVESPTLEPTQEAVEESARTPESLLGGDCDALVPAADVSALVGTTMTLHPVDTGLAYLAVEQVGGIYCMWSESEAAGDLAVSIVLLPPRVPSEDRLFDRCEAGWGCNFSRAFSTASAFGVLVDAVRSPEQNEVVAEALLTRIEPAVAGAVVPEPWVVPRPWSIPIECPTLTGAGVVGEILGEPGLVGNQYGGDAEPNTGWYASYFAAGVVRCTWDQTGSDVSVSAEYLSGGGWAKTTIAALEGAEAVSMQGVESVVNVGQDYHLFDGDNWVILHITEGAVTDAQRSAIAAAVVAEMNARG